jgi:hypothetical protein
MRSSLLLLTFCILNVLFQGLNADPNVVMTNYGPIRGYAFDQVRMWRGKQTMENDQFTIAALNAS